VTVAFLRHVQIFLFTCDRHKCCQRKWMLSVWGKVLEESTVISALVLFCQIYWTNYIKQLKMKKHISLTISHSVISNTKYQTQ